MNNRTLSIVFLAMMLPNFSRAQATDPAAAKTTETIGTTATSNKIDEHNKNGKNEQQKGKEDDNEKFSFNVIGGFEQGRLSSRPSQIAPFARVYLQSGPIPHHTRLWASVRLLGAPDPNETKGIISIFAQPTGQIDSTKLSSVGTAIDFTVGAAYRKTQWNNGNSIDYIIGFGGTTPLESNRVTQAFTVPVFGTAECNILYSKLGEDLKNPAFGVQRSSTGVATGSTTACLLNTNSATSSNGTTTYAPVNTLAFSNQDRTSFLLKDMVGVRFNHLFGGAEDGSCPTALCDRGSLDLSFGHDAAVTGGVLRGNRWIAKADGLFPVYRSNRTTVYVFGSFSTRIERNLTDNTPLILQTATLSTVSGTGTTAVPNVNTLVLPLRQPDRDFYRIGVGVDLLKLFTD